MPTQPTPVSPVRIAVIQFDPQVGLEQCDNNLCKGLELAEQAVREGANLIVLPELCNTGYTFTTRVEAYAHAESLEDGPSLRTWAAFAREHQVYLAAGFAERDGLKLYDSAVLFGPDGLLGHYRKAHLWDQEKLWFTPGNLGFPVF
ncbi:nitrilase-related carbon-nitrogen hydrolase, partial [Pseudomonas fontis]|nr:hydratase [Pseudomonas fontis]